PGRAGRAGDPAVGHDQRSQTHPRNVAPARLGTGHGPGQRSGRAIPRADPAAHPRNGGVSRMSARRDDLDSPDTSSIDPLAARLSVGASTPAHTPGTARPSTRHTPGSRPDPAGMRRLSLYVSAAAAEQLETAAEQIRSRLGEDTPRHVVLSALLQAGAEQAETVAAQLTEDRAAALRRRL